MDWTLYLENCVYFLAIINPASKLLFLSSYDPPLSGRQLLNLSWKSSLAAFAILGLFALVGQWILSDLFRVQLYSLRIVGGLVVFAVGWTAVREGRFFQRKEQEARQDFDEVSIVPIAAPLIAGPGTITIAISLAAQHGIGYCLMVVLLALTANFGLMLTSLMVNRGLNFLHLAGAMIRITGLMVAMVAMQMILLGLKEWLLLEKIIRP